MTRKKPALSMDEVEMRPDAWERFESAVKTAARAAPIHGTASKAPKKGKRQPKERLR